MVEVTDGAKIIKLYEFKTVEEFLSSPIFAQVAEQARKRAEAEIADNRQMSINEVRHLLAVGYETVKKLIAEGKLWVNADGQIPYRALIEYTNAGKQKTNK